jgi:hypothetical protein
MLTRPRSKDSRWVSYLVRHGAYYYADYSCMHVRKLTDETERFRAVQFFGRFADNFPSFQHYVTDSAEKLIAIFKSACEVLEMVARGRVLQRPHGCYLNDIIYYNKRQVIHLLSISTGRSSTIHRTMENTETEYTQFDLPFHHVKYICTQL